MIIERKLLHLYGAVERYYKKNDVVFKEGDTARFFYIVCDGGVKMINTSIDGKEFLQGMFKSGESFGEPPLLIDEPYPASAVVICDSRILRITREGLLKLIEENPEAQMKLVLCLAKRVYNKSVTAREIVNSNPEFRILGFLNTYKKQNCNSDDKTFIPYTRQEIANFTGLRVETVIRTLAKMKVNKKIEIVNRKLLY